VIGRENARDLWFPRLQESIQPTQARAVVRPYGHRELECLWELIVALRLDRDEVEGFTLKSGEVSG